MKCIGDYGHCDGGAEIRGLCRRCYGIARARVKAKLTTWPELEKLEMALPSRKPAAAKATAAFDEELAARREETAIMEEDASEPAARRSGTELQDQNEKNVAEDLAENMSTPVFRDPEGDLVTIVPPDPGFGANAEVNEQYHVNPSAGMEAMPESNIAQARVTEQTQQPKLSLRDRSLAAVATEPPEAPTQERAAEIAAEEARQAAALLGAPTPKEFYAAVDTVRAPARPTPEEYAAANAVQVPDESELRKSGEIFMQTHKGDDKAVKDFVARRSAQKPALLVPVQPGQSPAHPLQPVNGPVTQGEHYDPSVVSAEGTPPAVPWQYGV